jgi:hypothetical protein
LATIRATLVKQGKEMKKSEIDPFIPEPLKQHKAKTLKAIYQHFCQGETVAMSAASAGIARETAEAAIGPIRQAVLKSGWIMETERKITYRKK